MSGRPSGSRRRRGARRTALDILYQADVTEQSPSEVLEQWRSAGRSISEHTQGLVRGVQSLLPELDRLFGGHAEGWAVHRMAVVDRSILRLACYELRAGVPVSVAINEAVNLAKELSTEDSGRFINGILGKIAREMEEAASTERA